jgi:hypothetical protein
MLKAYYDLRIVFLLYFQPRKIASVHLPLCKSGIYLIKSPLTPLFQRGGLNAYEKSFDPRKARLCSNRCKKL